MQEQRINQNRLPFIRSSHALAYFLNQTNLSQHFPNPPPPLPPQKNPRSFNPKRTSTTIIHCMGVTQQDKKFFIPEKYSHSGIHIFPRLFSGYNGRSIYTYNNTRSQDNFFGHHDSGTFPRCSPPFEFMWPPFFAGPGKLNDL